MRVLITGMSGTGKSTLVAELRTRGYAAHDADEEFSEPREDGRWGWRMDLVSELLARAGDDLVFLAGCSEEQAEVPFDFRLLLTCPREEMVKRMHTRATNSYGSSDQELAQVLSDLVEVEPLLWRSADLILSSETDSPAELADRLLAEMSD